MLQYKGKNKTYKEQYGQTYLEADKDFEMKRNILRLKNWSDKSLLDNRREIQNDFSLHYKKKLSIIGLRSNINRSYYKFKYE